MLRILGSRQRLCDGLTRREMLRAGGIGLLGLDLAGFLQLREAQAATPTQGFGKAKACILLFLYGSPSQLETFDPKPDAPVEIRGELKSIRSSLPGADCCELLPHISRVLHKVTTIRSLTHPYPLHGVAYATTAAPHIDVPMELNPRDGRHHPFIGSVVSHLTDRSGRRSSVPANLALPFPFSSQRVGEVARAGPYAAYLGSAYNPVWTRFNGVANVRTKKTLNDQEIEVAEPYMGITADSRFEIGAPGDRVPELTLDRLDARASLVEQLDRQQRHLSASDAGRSLDRNRALAVELMRSPRIRTALDLDREPMPMRESYGMTIFGQACLTARRLVEAGSRFVSVFWDEFGFAGSGWDTHWQHYSRMKNELCPGFDRAFSGLINDLDARGLLDETLVLCLSEHGRTPKLSTAKGGGRDHWSRAYSGLMAGAGVARGKVIGRTDKIGGDVIERPVSPKDVLATTYHLLGIDPATTLTDRTGRPSAIVQEGAVLQDVLNG
jgi:Protein of unknown function (DUF1501)